MKLHIHLFVVLSLSTAFLTSSCSYQYSASYVRTGKISGDGIVIAAADGERFILEGGREFRTPFHGRCYNFDSYDDPMLQLIADMSKTPEDYRNGLRNGGRRVLITVPGLDKQLYGVLLFCALPDTAYGPAAFSYFVQIPQEYIEQAKSGLISVVWEDVDWRDVDHNRTNSHLSWILWISDRPLH